MLSNYLKIALRNFWNQRVYTLINITGLSVGIACFIGIIAYTNSELNYDKHHNNSENIFRVKLIGDMSGTAFEAAVTGAPVGKILFEELPEVNLYTRLIQYPRSILFDYNEKKIYQEGIIYADSSFFNMFKYMFSTLVLAQGVLRKKVKLDFTEGFSVKHFILMV